MNIGSVVYKAIYNVGTYLVQLFLCQATKTFGFVVGRLIQFRLLFFSISIKTKLPFYIQCNVVFCSKQCLYYITNGV